MIIDFISKVWVFITGFADILFNIVEWCLDAVVYILLQIPFALYKLVLSLVYGIVNLISVGSLAVDMASGWALIPPQLAYVIGQTGIDTGLSMLATAYAIRFGLNLIPAAVTRV